MSSAPLLDQHISGTSATDHSLAIAGTVHGNVNFNARESSPSPEPYSTVPFRRDPDFVDRGDLLLRVDGQCSQPAGRAALVGLGGVGKSQLAIEYAHRTRERSPETWVFWVHASNGARFEQGCRDIADVIKIAERRDPKVDIFKLVHDWLRGCERKWLIILDNVDDADFLVDTQAATETQSSDSGHRSLRPLRDFLPQSQNGSILITTRNRESALKLSEPNDLISVDPMDASNAVGLLDKKLNSTGQGSKKELTELAAVLEFMPLAIVQAASYISQLSPRYSVRQYIDDFQKSDRKKSSLLNHEGGGLRRDSEAKNSIIITWQISFEHIRRTRQPAAELLSLMSFFDPQGIPEILVRGRAGDSKHTILEGPDNNGKQSDENSDYELTDDGFEMDVRTLRDFSFVSNTSDPKIFEMHRLVQLAMRKWLDANDQLEKWKEQYVKILYEEMPDGEYENWACCQVLFPHAKSAFTQRPKAETSLEKWASLLHNAAYYALQKGNVNEAIDLSETAMRVREKMLGQEHRNTLQSMTMLSQIYILKGRLKEAEELAMQSMETSKRFLSENDPDALTITAHLASIHIHHRRWGEAEKLQKSTLQKREKVLSKEHPSTLTNMINLALIYMNQNRFEEAEELNIHIIETGGKMLGEEHPDILISVSNLSLTYFDQGRWQEAEELGKKVMKIREKVLGKEHPSTLTSMSNLAVIYSSQRRWKETEDLQLQVIKSRKKILGKEHYETLISMNNLVVTYSSQRRWQEAEELGEEVMKMIEKVLGKEHPDHLMSMINLTCVWRGQGRNRQAINLLDECVLLSTRVLGADHPNTLDLAAALTEWRRQESRTSHSAASDSATTEREQGRLDEASHQDVSSSQPTKKWLFT